MIVLLLSAMALMVGHIVHVERADLVALFVIIGLGAFHLDVEIVWAGTPSSASGIVAR